jgi:hypothetical protein
VADPKRDAIEVRVPGFDYGTTYAGDRTTYSYWLDHGAVGPEM